MVNLYRLAIALLLGVFLVGCKTPGETPKEVLACNQFVAGQLATTKGFPRLTGVVQGTFPDGTMVVTFAETARRPVEFRCTDLTPGV
jgi:hypothetical protein